MMPLPSWMRAALYATAVMNVLAGASFLPAAKPVRRLVGLPEDGHPLYVATVAMFIYLFGLAYLWTAIVGYADPVLIALAAAGKLSFFVILVCAWAMGAIPLRAPILGSADLFFSILFAIWLFGGS
jgi:hypothetical protein